MLWSFTVFNLIYKRNEAMKQQKGILGQLSLKKGKALAQEKIHLIHAFYEDDEYSRQLPVKKDYVSMQKVVHKQKQLVL